MPSKHKTYPVSFRPAEADREWLLSYSAATGIPVNRILADALTVFRAQLPVYCAEHMPSGDDTPPA